MAYDAELSFKSLKKNEKHVIVWGQMRFVTSLHWHVTFSHRPIGTADVRLRCARGSSTTLFRTTGPPVLGTALKRYRSRANEQNKIKNKQNKNIFIRKRKVNRNNNNNNNDYDEDEGAIKNDLSRSHKYRTLDANTYVCRS